MSIDVERARVETPGVANVLHFNNAGSALMPTPVIEAVHGHLDREAAIGGYEAAAAAAEAIENAYPAIARLINARPHEIAVIENATRAWDMAFYALAETLGEGDRILTAEAEYVSNYIPYLQLARKKGVVVDTVPSDESGALSLPALENMVDDRVKLIAITHVPTNGGLVNPAAAVGRVARAAGIPYLLDACQSVGQLPVDVEEIGCDFLSATGRKFLRAPRGTGFLYVRGAWIERLEPPFLDLRAADWTGPDSYRVRGDARRFENWETYVAGKIALGVAADYAVGWGPAATWERIRALAGRLRGGLAAIPGATCHDIGAEQCGIVTFTVDGRAPGQIQAALAERGMNTTVSGAGSTLIDMRRRGLDAINRASVHYYNDEDEVDRFLDAVEAIAGSDS